MSRSCCTPAGICGTCETCKKFVSLSNFSLPSPVSSSPLFLPRLYACPLYLPWFPPEHVGFWDMEQSRVFPVPFSSRSVSLEEMEFGGGWNLFLLCSQPICLQSWLVPPSSQVQRASLSAFAPAAALDQVRFDQAQSQPEKMHIFYTEIYITMTHILRWNYWFHSSLCLARASMKFIFVLQNFRCIQWSGITCLHFSNKVITRIWGLNWTSWPQRRQTNRKRRRIGGSLSGWRIMFNFDIHFVSCKEMNIYDPN